MVILVFTLTLFQIQWMFENFHNVMGRCLIKKIKVRSRHSLEFRISLLKTLVFKRYLNPWFLKGIFKQSKDVL